LQGLGWENVAVGTSAIHVERGWDPREGEIPTKNRKSREVPLCATLQTLLLEHRRRTGRSEGALFGPLGWRFQADADAAWKKHGLERVTPHECRPAFENFLEAAGVWPTRAERYFGHSDPTVTGRYRHQLPGQLEADAALLDEYLTGAVSGA
jgi:integrase